MVIGMVRARAEGDGERRSVMEHPHSPLHGRGQTFPTPATLEEHGRTWQGASEEYLIGFVMESEGPNAANQAPAVMEMQRRLVTAVRAAGDSADNFAAQTQRLNTSILFYTIALFLLGLVQIGLMFWKG
jgi:hypothetical protein